MTEFRTARALVLLLLFAAGSAMAQVARPAPAPPIIGAQSYLLIDAVTGHELASLEPDERLAPASLTKLMTAYVVFSALEQGQITLEDEVSVSEKAWRTGGSRMFIEVGTRVAIRDLLLGMIVQSGNDASVALAEHIAGTESVFAELMNQYAAELGMTSSHFVNATGLPDDKHVSSARDLAILARAIIRRFPEYYKWYSVREFTWSDITQGNRNRLLWRDPSVDGMKTGRTDDAGWCLVSSAERDGMRVVAVVLGTSSDRARVEGSQALINYGFRFFETRLLYSAGEEVTRARTWKAANEFTPVGVLDDLYITIPRGSYDSLEMLQSVPALLSAPIVRGQPIADITISLSETVLLSKSLRALEDNPTGSIWQRARDSVRLWFE